MGLLLTDLRADFAATKLLPLAASSLAPVSEAFATLSARAQAWFDHEEITAEARQMHRTVDMRYAGELRTVRRLAGEAPSPRPRWSICGSVRGSPPPALRLHRGRGSGADRHPARRGRRPREEGDAQGLPAEGPDASAAIIGKRPVWFPEAGDYVPTPIYDREALKAGNRFAGPAIVEQMTPPPSSPPGMTARVDAYHNLILEVAA